MKARRAGKRLASFLILLAAVPLLSAEPAIGPEQLLRMVIHGIETEAADADLARQVEHTKLTQQVSEEAIHWLSTAGAGSKTVKALHKLQERSASLPAAPSPVVAFEPRPSADESNRILHGAIDYVNRYTTTLVDFTCTVSTRTYTKETAQSRPLSDTSIAITNSSDWRQGKTVTQEVSYHQGREYFYSGQHAQSKDVHSLTPGASWTNGEFAHTLRISFDSSSQGRFDWDHWEWQGGKRLAVFSYAVAAAHSQMAIDTQVIRSGVWQNAQIAPAYHGFLSIDPESGTIFRLVANTVGIPSEYAIDQGNTVLDYGPVAIAGKTYFLLTEATSFISTKQYKAMFQKSFTQYRKFEAESKLVGDLFPQASFPFIAFSSRQR